MVMPTGNDDMITNGGLVNDAIGMAFYIASKVYFGGTAIIFDTSHANDADGNMWIKHAEKTDRPIGYTLKSTLDPIVPANYVSDSSYLTSIKTTVNRYRDGENISVPLCYGHAAIVKGDKVGVSTTGEFDKFSEISGCVYSIGIALDPVDVCAESAGAAGINATCVRIRTQIVKEL